MSTNAVFRFEFRLEVVASSPEAALPLLVEQLARVEIGVPVFAGYRHPDGQVRSCDLPPEGMSLIPGRDDNECVVYWFAVPKEEGRRNYILMSAQYELTQLPIDSLFWFKEEWVSVGTQRWAFSGD